ncbi:adenosylcobinamide-GDP ribazoletransferase [Paenibacillus sp. y28]|uniref:adenosylcobinamide-GDP ribazoletransferase n=1 Tax=Paenibacillus sp. y28 TaxID=3129110 RepID=UPI00301A2E06
MAAASINNDEKRDQPGEQAAGGEQQAGDVQSQPNAPKAGHHDGDVPASSLKLWLAAMGGAFKFLTRLPWPFPAPYSEQAFRRSVVFYPLVGLAIGLLLAACSYAGSRLLPPLPAAVLLAGLWTALSGALHLDGLMDTADGLFSHRSRERRLEIMKDSRVGAMGVITCVFMVLWKISLLSALLPASPSAAVALALIPLWSRCFMVWAITGWPYARAEGGLGGLLAGIPLRYAAAATVLAAVLSAALLWPLGFAADPGGGLHDLRSEAAGTAALVLFLGLPAVGALCAIGTAAVIARKLGGQTGDTYGAINELVEAVLLAVVLCWTQAWSI